jgi:cell division septum initiation protein DivIVA
MAEPGRRRAKRIDVQEKLGEIRKVVDEARSMPMSASVMINRGDLLFHLEELEKGMAQALSDATSLVATRDEVVGEGQETAAELINQAQLERERIVSDTEVYKLAKREAETLIANAKVEAEALRKEADDYVDGKLANFEITLERTLDAVKRGRDRLLGRSALDELGSEELDSIELPDHLTD